MFAENYGSPVIHRRMLRDTVRCEAYRQAVLATVRPGDVVADVGAGTGILSVFAAQAGARRVYAVECTDIVHVTQKVLADNGVDGCVQIVRGDMAAVDLPEPVDVILSEWIGSYGDDENLLRGVLTARDRWLKPGGKLVPYHVSTWLAPAYDAHLDRDLSFWRSAPYRVDLGVLAEQKAHEPLFPDYQLSREDLLAAPQPLWTAQAEASTVEDTPLPFHASVVFPVIRPGRLTSLVAWFEAEVAPGIYLTNAPGAPRTHWRVAEFPLDHAIRVEPGREVAVEFICEPAGPGACHVSWSVRPSGGSWEHHSTRTLAQALRLADDASYGYSYAHV